MDGIDFDRIKQTPLMTSKEAAQLLRISERTLWAMTMPRGSIPAVRIGRQVRYSPDAIQQWIVSQLNTVGSKA